MSDRTPGRALPGASMRRRATPRPSSFATTARRRCSTASTGTTSPRASTALSSRAIRSKSRYRTPPRRARSTSSLTAAMMRTIPTASPRRTATAATSILFPWHSPMRRSRRRKNPMIPIPSMWHGAWWIAENHFIPSREGKRSTPTFNTAVFLPSFGQIFTEMSLQMNVSRM